MTEATTATPSPVATTAPPKPRQTRMRDVILYPLLAVFTALILGGILILVTDRAVVQAWLNFFDDPMAALRATGHSLSTAYGAMFEGSLNFGGILRGIGAALRGEGTQELAVALVPLAESLTQAVPYIFAGLAVAFAFQGGLFNIGGEGQMLVGALCSVYIGFKVTGLPWYVHLPLAMFAGIAGGAIWAAIVGVLKAYTGAHEVINTIMMNWIAISLSTWLLKVGGPMARPDVPVTPPVLETAWIPRLFDTPGNRFHAGFFLALFTVWLIWWILYKSTLGFQIRMVGANARAAKYSGVNVKRLWIAVMAISGALAGTAGMVQTLGVDRWVGVGFSSGMGFDAIALALLGKNHPVGVLLAALLFGTLKNGATRMQSVAQIPVDIITIVIALVIVFIAAPEIIRWLYRLRQPVAKEGPVFSKGWGS
ncbi:MAG: ABC transporter permease [Caldilineales bacterium]|nr:ABC transporter permease [Caldilineales bacterium]MDW8316899.1 ABC transporter permease [Anaerolineae bacterium]